MRYDVPVYFQRRTRGAYDADTGDYGADTVEETKAYAGVYDTRESTLRLVYGSIREGSLTVHLQNHYTEPFDSVRIGEKTYKVDKRRRLRTKEAFIISEVQ